MKKRGQAQIITIILIILLVLSAIIIIWNVVKKTVEESSRQVGTDAFVIQLKVEDVKLWITGGAKVRVKRISGKGEVASLKFIFYDETGETHIFEKSEVIPNELETKIYDFSASEIDFKVEKVSIVPVFSGGGLGIESFESESLIKRDDAGNRILDAPEFTISWWGFDGGAGDWVGKNDGEAVGVSFVDDGVRGGVVSFEGAGYVNYGSDSDFDITNEVTISVWAKPTALDQILTGIVDKIQTYRIMFNQEERFIFNYMNTAGQWPNYPCGAGTCPLYATTPVVNLNQWYHIVAVKDATNFLIYLDGDLEDTETGIGDIILSDWRELEIGRRDALRYFEGSIDDVIIFNRALTPEEIQAMYNIQLK